MALILSGLDLFTQATLEPTLHWLFDKNNCQKRTQALIQRGIPELDARQRISLKCSEDRLHGQTEGFEFRRCPCQYIHPAAGPLIAAAQLMKQGCLPFEGGYMDQPAGVMEGIGIVQRFMHELEEKEHEKSTKKAPAVKKGHRG